MGPFYSSMCSELGREVDTSLLSELEAANKAELAKLEEGIEDATKNFGETEQRDALMAKAEYLCKIGDKVRRKRQRDISKHAYTEYRITKHLCV